MKGSFRRSIGYVRTNDKRLYSSIEEKLSKYIAYCFIRELYWIHKHRLPIEYFDEKYSIEVFTHWVMARSSISMIGLVPDLLSRETRHKIEKPYGLIRRKWSQYWSKVIDQYQDIQSQNLHE